ncbi:MAG: sporulation protein YqfD [Oscillospiraceae bacterium]
MERATNLIRGCVRAEISGAFPGNFLNILAKNGVAFWDAQPMDAFTLRVSLRLGDWERAKKLAVRVQCAAELLGKKGAPVVKRRLRRRIALLLCAVLCVSALGVSSLFVWDIEIGGNEQLTKGEILRALEDCGVTVGAFWPNFSSELIRNEMTIRLPELSWLAVNVKGSRAEVIIRERRPKPVIIDNDTPVSVTARKTGIITKMNVLQGAPTVKPGQVVLEGETLISGSVDNLVGATRTVHAMAEVMAHTYYEMSATAELSEYKKTYTGAKHSRYALILGGTRINFYADSGNCGVYCDKIITERSFAVRDIFTLPVTLVRERFAEYTLTETQRDRAALRQDLEATLKKTLLLELGKNGKPISSTFVSEESGGVMTVTLRVECLENIAVETPLVP